MQNRKTFTVKEYAKLVEIQDALNTQVNVNWRAANYAFYRAIYIEAAEAIDHTAWKWWSGKEEDTDALKLELVDMLHFVISDAIIQNGGLNELTVDSYKDIIEGDGCLFCTVLARYSKTPVIELMEEIALHALYHKNTLVLSSMGLCLLFLLFDRFQMDIEDVIKHYVGKYTLNMFRNVNGYPEGLYNREWAGMDDNYVLTELLEEHPLEDIDRYITLITEELQTRYDAAKNS